MIQIVKNPLFLLLIFFFVCGGLVLAAELGIIGDKEAVPIEDNPTPADKLIYACGEISNYKIGEYSCDEKECKSFVDINGEQSWFMWENNVDEKICVINKDTNKTSCSTNKRDMTKEELETTKLSRAKSLVLSIAKSNCTIKERETPKPQTVDGNVYEVTIK